MANATGNRQPVTWLHARFSITALIAGLLSGCADPGAGDQAAAVDLLTAVTLGEQQVFDNREYLDQPPYSEADATEGERVAMFCRACHTFGPGEPDMVGPNLHGFFGRVAGTGERFPYSDALSESGFRWTPRALDAWLQSPGRFLPGNQMTFAGVRDPQDRANLIAYLLSETDPDE